MIGILVLFAFTGTSFAKTEDSKANDSTHSGTGSWMMCSEPESVEELANIDSANVTMDNVSMNDRDEISYASGKTWYVDDDGGPGIDFKKIQDAVNETSNGDTIIVYNGTYFEDVVVNKQLMLKGIDMPIVDAGGNGNAITITTSGCVLDGFKATGSPSCLTRE
jgi:pectin methylesterase-like acyl-CoA thioesterase